MPTYTYRCAKCDQKFEKNQRITEDPFKIHSEADVESACDGELTKLLHAPMLDFSKGGSGFYVNDYKNGSTESSKTDTSTTPKEAPKPTKKLQEVIKT